MLYKSTSLLPDTYACMYVRTNAFIHSSNLCVKRENCENRTANLIYDIRLGKGSKQHVNYEYSKPPILIPRKSRSTCIEFMVFKQSQYILPKKSCFSVLAERNKQLKTNKLLFFFFGRLTLLKLALYICHIMNFLFGKKYLDG